MTTAYEIGVHLALADVGLEKRAGVMQALLRPGWLGALGRAAAIGGLGAGIGALGAGEGNRLRGALIGGLTGLGASALGTGIDALIARASGAPLSTALNPMRMANLLTNVNPGLALLGSAASLGGGYYGARALADKLVPRTEPES